MRKPNLFLVGAPKCGTTSMAQYLSVHPDVFMAGKEPTYKPFIPDQHFGRRFHSMTDDEPHYLATFRRATSEKWVLDATPLYLYSKNAAERIQAFSPGAKIIIILRDPVALMYSLHRMNLGHYNEDLCDFDEALAAEPDRLVGRRIPKYSSHREIVFYRTWVEYSSQVERYLNVFGQDNVRVIIFDDFTADTRRVYRDTLRFLEIDDEFETDFRISNAATAHTKGRAFLSRHPLLRNFVSHLPASVRRVGEILVDPFLPPLKPQGKLRAETRNRLLAEMAPDIHRLENLLNRKLTAWYPDSAAVEVQSCAAPSNSDQSR